MAQDLQISTAAALPAIDLNNPSSILSLPAWLGTRLGTVSNWGEEMEIEGRRRPTIPFSSTLTGEMRAVLERRCVDLERATLPGPESDTLLKVGEMLRFFSGQRITDAMLDIKIGVYMLSVGCLPAWAVCEAINRWYAGEAGAAAVDYQFAPAPGVLKPLAQRIADVPAGQIVRFRRLLDAAPVRELGSEQLRKNALRLSDLSGEVKQATAMQSGRARAPSPRETRMAADLEQRRLRREEDESLAIPRTDSAPAEQGDAA